LAFILCDFYSKAMGKDTGIDMIFPEYGQIGEDKIRLCLLLHGQGQDASFWIRRTDIEQTAGEQNLAVVMPQVAESFFTPIPNEKNFTRFLREELPDFLIQTFPFLSEDAKDHLIVGNGKNSMGKIRETVEAGCSFYDSGKCLPCDFKSEDLRDLLSQWQTCADKEENPEGS